MAKPTAAQKYAEVKARTLEHIAEHGSIRYDQVISMYAGGNFYEGNKFITRMRREKVVAPQLMDADTLVAFGTPGSAWW